MTITWLGHACFKIQSDDTTIVIDPYGEAIGFSLPQFHSDIVLMTHGHFDHSNTEAFSDAGLVVKNPGNYELQGVTIQGVQTFHDDVQGKERGLNTIYKITAEGISILHMGDFGETELRKEIFKEIGLVDILMIPVGGKYTIDGAQAAQMARRINAKIVIPMHYFIPGLKVDISGPEVFLKEMNTSNKMPQEKLEIDKNDLVEMRQEVILFSRIG